jgi:2,5-diketo-D-gluconate reductase A
VELHPTFRQPATVERSRAHGIVPEAYSPLGQGADLEAPAVVGIANELGVTPGQVVLRWQVQHGVILIPKSVNPERMATNLDLFSFSLTEAQMADIDALDSPDGRIGADPATASFTQFRS